MSAVGHKEERLVDDGGCPNIRMAIFDAVALALTYFL
jgi:hypothetical protein